VRALLERLREAERDAPTRRFADHLAELTIDEADAEKEHREDDDDAEDAPVSDEARMHRDALVELGREYLAAEAGLGSVAGFAGWLDASTRGENARGAGVDLATFHRAKGLEWPVVFVTGLERGLVPVSWATSDEAVAEERRLLHVALSRAEDELHCSWARARSVGARRSARDPSPWLGALEATVHAMSGPPRDPARYVTELRDTLSEASPPQPKPRSARRQIR
jgi:superfamily I DNA/RNA helicase